MYANLRLFLLLLAYVGVLNAQSQTTFKKLTTGTIVNTPLDSRSVNFADFNVDGLEDLLITQGNSAGASDLIYYNKGDLTFELQPQLTNQISEPSVGATVGDMDNDGLSDIYVSTWYHRKNTLYRGTTNNGFDITQMNPNSYSESATWGDYDNDGYLDLYVCNSGNSTSDNRNLLFKNNAGTLSLLTNHPLVQATNHSRHATWVDYDQDGDVDLFICNENQTRNELFRNEGSGSFIKITAAGDLLLEASGSMGASWGDVNNDGWMDVFICNSGYFVGQANRLYINNGDGTFTKRTGVYESDNGCSFSSSFSDYDNDGDLDLVVTNGFCNGIIKNYLYLNNGLGNFTKDQTSMAEYQTPCSFGTAWGDINNDGFQDLVVANCQNNSQSPFANNDIWINEGNGYRWLKIKLKGSISNASGHGAKVYLSSIMDGVKVKQLRTLGSVSGYCGQNSSILHFGLKDGTLVDTLEVVWPSGIIQTLTKLKTNEMLVINEGSINANSDDEKIVSFVLSPNPTSTTLDIKAQFTNVADTILLELISSNGVVVYKKICTNIEENWDESILIKDLKLSSGTYHVKASSRSWSISKSIVIIP